MSFAGGSLIFAVFLILFVVAVMYALYSRQGSGISQHPYGNRYGGAPGAFRSSTLDHDHDASSLLTRRPRRHRSAQAREGRTVRRSPSG